VAKKKRASKRKQSVLSFVGKAFYSIGKVLSIPAMPHDAATLLKAPSNWKKVGKTKGYGSTRVWSVQAAKDAGRSFGEGCTLNDVVMASLSNAMRKYLISRECKVMKKKNKGLKLRALAVVNTRMGGSKGSAGEDPILEDFKQCKAANEFSYVIPTLPLGDMSVSDRVKFCSKDMSYLKTSPEAIVIKKLNNGLRDCFGAPFTLAFNADYVVNKLTCFFSNLPGPTTPLKCFGVGVGRLSNFVHPMMYGTGLSIQSYNGEIIVNCSCDKEIVPDPEVFMAFADEAFEEICKEGREKEEGGSNDDSI